MPGTYSGRLGQVFGAYSERALGTYPERLPARRNGIAGFQDQCCASADQRVRGAAEDSPVATVVPTFATQGVTWSGKPAELYNTIAKMVGDRLAITKIVGGGLRGPLAQNRWHVQQRIAPNRTSGSLNGVSIQFIQSNDRRVVTLKSEERKKGTHPLDYNPGCCKLPKVLNTATAGGTHPLDDFPGCCMAETPYTRRVSSLAESKGRR
jgi:hypothetical protein